MSGILVLWNDCLPGREVVYEDWYQEEHFKEILGMAGFKIGRRFEAVEAERRFFTTYEVQSPAVLASKVYLERTSNPTPRTVSIIESGFSKMSRNICERFDVIDSIRGSFCVTASIQDISGLSLLREVGLSFAETAKMPHREIWVSAEGRAREYAAEEQIRGPDDKIAACLALEFLREASAREVAANLRRRLSIAKVGVFRLLCALTTSKTANKG
ncbi:hypothetical protein V5F59_24190 [Xanthobacter autotrophicus DSM 431]|uniref:hypothetical protein n=1 Tax=Xanthobacter nonsaccharivorans TaxID=3119912 RepID=UPI0037268BFB